METLWCFLVAQLLTLTFVGATQCGDERLCPASFPIRSDIGLTENCEGDGATSIRNSIRNDVISVINAEVKRELNSILQAKYIGLTERYPATSCREVLDFFPDAESGTYWLRSSADSVFQAYCDMELGCGPDSNITGWMRIANVDLSDPSQSCPPGDFVLNPGPNRYCVRRNNIFGCDSSIFSVQQVPYTQVCGRATGIQIGTVDGFLEQFPGRSIDDVYTDGISLTYGSNPRNHIWTFAAAISEIFTTCPCSDGSVDNSPSYVGNNYFCESAATTGTVGNSAFPNDDLWDGELCRSVEVPCCAGNFRPPWFYRDLGNQQTSDIEMRLCIDQGGDEDVGLITLELYIQ